MNNKTYDILKWIAQYLLPAAGTLYFALSSIWGLPYGEEVVGTITAVDAFLGMLLGISTVQYNKTGVVDGVLEIDTNDPNTDKYNLVITGDLGELKNKELVKLKVNTDVNLSQQ